MERSVLFRKLSGVTSQSQKPLRESRLPKLEKGDLPSLLTVQNLFTVPYHIQLACKPKPLRG